MYAVNKHDTGHIGIHGRVDVRTYVRTVDNVMAIKPKFLRRSASMGHHIFLTIVLGARGAPLLPGNRLLT